MRTCSAEKRGMMPQNIGGFITGETANIKADTSFTDLNDIFV